MPPVPALQSYWIKIHVPLVVSSYAAFAVAFATASLFLLKYYGNRALARRRVVARGAAASAGFPDLGMRMEMYVAASSTRVVGIAREEDAITAAALAGNVFARWLRVGCRRSPCSTSPPIASSRWVCRS